MPSSSAPQPLPLQTRTVQCPRSPTRERSSSHPPVPFLSAAPRVREHRQFRPTNGPTHRHTLSGTTGTEAERPSRLHAPANRNTDPHHRAPPGSVFPAPRFAIKGVSSSLKLKRPWGEREVGERVVGQQIGLVGVHNATGCLLWHPGHPSRSFPQCQRAKGGIFGPLPKVCPSGLWSLLERSGYALRDIPGSVKSSPTLFPASSPRALLSRLPRRLALRRGAIVFHGPHYRWSRWALRVVGPGNEQRDAERGKHRSSSLPVIPRRHSPQYVKPMCAFSSRQPTRGRSRVETTSQREARRLHSLRHFL